MCPYYLDGDLTEPEGPVGDTRYAQPRLSKWLGVATVQFSRAAERACAGTDRRGGRPSSAGLSKLNSMHRLKLRVVRRSPGQARSTC